MKFVKLFLITSVLALSYNAFAAKECSIHNVRFCKTSCKIHGMKYALCDMSKGYFRCGCYTNSKADLTFIKSKGAKANSSRSRSRK